MKQKLLTLISIMLLPIVASRAATEIGGIYYNLSETGAEVTKGSTSYSGAVIIPSSVTYNGNVYSVTSIDNSAFSGCSGLTSVTIPNSVTSIEGFAFSGCSGLTSVTIPNSVTSIGYDAFEGCSGLTSITIPGSVTSIGTNPLTGCSALTSVVVQSENKVFDSRNNCNAIIKTATNTLIAGCKNTTIPNSVTSIGNDAFNRCRGLTSITIPNSVTSIGNDAFRGCSSLTSVTIPNSVTSIGNDAFSYCSGLTSVTIPNSVTSIGNSAFHGCSSLTSVTIPNSVTSISYYAFDGCSSLNTITIPNSVTSIGYYAFSNCSSLNSIVVESGNTKYDSRNNCNAIIETSTNTLVAGCKNTTIPNSVTSIGNYAFIGCSGLTSIIIPNSVTSIGDHAFQHCSSLTSITIPNSVTSIGNYAFYGCSSLTSITIPNGVTIGGEAVFCGCSSLTDFWCYAENVPKVGYDNDIFDDSPISSATLHVPAASIEQYKATEPWSGFGTIVAIESDNTNIQFADANVKALCVANWDTNKDGELSIEEAAAVTYLSGVFINKTSITSFDELQYFTGLTSIGSEAFYGCSGLTSITIPNSVTSIGSYAFSNCSGLTSVTIPNSVTSIGYSAFERCSGLTSVTIPNSVTSIGYLAFSNCSGLTSVTIPNSVTSIGSEAFSGCKYLTSVTSKIQEPFATGGGAFYGIPSDATLYVPAGTESKYRALADWNRFTNIVAIEGQGQEYDCDWTIGKGGDFADIKAAMEDSRVQDGHVLQLLPGTSIGGSSYINNKAVTIKGNGYKDTSDGYIGSVYIDCDNVTLRQLYLGNVYIRANNATIEHCRAGYISGTENYDADDATIHGCFVTGTVHSYYNNVCYGWNISNNIIFASNVWGNILDYLEEATVDHNLIINYNNENITGVYAVGAVKHSSFTNNIFIRQMFSQGISPDATDSAEKFEYNIVSNTGTYSKWPTNKTGYRNMEELFVCTGEWTTDTYYKLAAGSPAIGYANDGGNCGPWSGKYPYWKDGIEPDPTHWKLDPTLTTDPEQHEFASLDALIGYMLNSSNIVNLKESVTVNVTDGTYTMDVLSYLMRDNYSTGAGMVEGIYVKASTLEGVLSDIVAHLKSQGITFNMEAPHEAIFQFNIQNSESLPIIEKLIQDQVAAWLEQGMSQEDVNSWIAGLAKDVKATQERAIQAMKLLADNITLTNITVYIDGKLYPADPTNWTLDPKLTTNAEQHEFATLDGFVNYLLDNCFNLKESIKVNVADATYTMDVIPNLGNSNDVDELIINLLTIMEPILGKYVNLEQYCKSSNITLNMEAPHAAVLQFNIRNSQAVKQIQNAIAAKMQEMLAQGKSQDEVNAEAAKWYVQVESIIKLCNNIINDFFSLIKATNISLVVDPTQQWKLDPKLNNNPEQYEFATLDALMSYLLTHPLTESIQVNVADATYSMEVIPSDMNLDNYSVEQVFGLVREKMSVIKAMLDYYAAYPLISIYMKAPNEAIFKIYMQKCLALYYQIPAYLNYKAYEMLAEGKSRTEVAQQMAAWKAEFEVIKKEALNYMQMLASRITTTNISILIDPDDDLVPDPVLIDPDDLLCLTNLYKNLGGSSWTSKKWKVSDDKFYSEYKKEDFPGVNFDDEGYVVQINLENNNLRGSINPSNWTWELGLPRLSGLYLQKNNISGNLSPWLHDADRAGRLKALDMSYNNLTKISDSIPSSITSLDLRNQNREWYRPSGVTIDPLKIEVMKDMQTVRLYLSSKQSVSLPSLFTYDHKSQTHSAKPDIHIVNAQGLDKYGSFYSTTGGSYALSWGNEEYTEKQDAPCYIRFGGPYDGSVYPAYLRYIEGDANISGYTDVVDVQITLNYVLAGGGVSQFNRSAANTYADNIINVQDIVCTVNIVLDDLAAPEDIVTTPSSTRRRLRRAAEAIDAQGWLYTEQGRVVISSAEEVGSIDVELKGVSTRQVSLMLNHSQYQMIGRDTEFGSRYIIFSPTGQPIPASEEVTLLAVSSQAEVVAAQAADMEAQEMILAIGQPTGIAQVLGGALNATFQGNELVVTSTTDIQNLSLRLYSTGGQMVLVNEEDSMPKGELRMQAPVSPGAYILEMTTRQGGRKIVKLMKR